MKFSLSISLLTAIVLLGCKPESSVSDNASASSSSPETTQTSNSTNSNTPSTANIPIVATTVQPTNSTQSTNTTASNTGQIETEFIPEAKNQVHKPLSTSVHPSVKDFGEPLIRCLTDNFTIHIYYSQEEGYTYTSWVRKKTTNDRPDLIMKDGTREAQGNKGLSNYSFNTGPWRYQFTMDNVEGNHYLKVYQGEAIKMEEKVTTVY